MLIAHTASTAPVAFSVLIVPIAFTTLIASSVLIAPIASTTPRQLLPDRPKVLIQAYLAKKEAWLAQHLTVRPTEYRKARK